MGNHIRINHANVHADIMNNKVRNMDDNILLNLSLLYGTTTITRNIMESLFFRRLLGKPVPSMRSIVEEMEYQSSIVVQKITEELKIVNIFHLCLDIWTMHNCQSSYITVNAHYDVNNKKEISCLGVESIVSHTASNTKFIVENILSKYNVDLQKIGFVITDNAASMKKAFIDYNPSETNEIIEEEDCFEY